MKKILKSVRKWISEEKKAEELIKKAKQYQKQEEKKKEVLVLETSYLLGAGFPDTDNKNIFLPKMCLEELEQVQANNEKAKEVLLYHWNKMVLIELKSQFLYNNSANVEERSRVVISICVRLMTLGFNVSLYTKSKEIKSLAKLQKCGINVVS